MTSKDFDFAQKVFSAAGERWMKRTPERAKAVDKINKGEALAAEDPRRVQLRIDRLSEAVSKEREARTRLETNAFPGKPSLVDKIGRERIIDRPDFQGMDFLETALAVARYVCRIQVRSGTSSLEGYGTGFMVSQRLLLTNNHVLETKDIARFSLAEFDYQLDRMGRMLPVVTFELQPDVFYYTDTNLDFTLVAVREVSTGGVSLANYGWTRMIGGQGKALLGDPLNIIQHPRGEAKQIVLRSNRLVDLTGDFAHYETDTERGASGSPVFSDQWELVALHHSSVPAMEGGKIIAVDGSVWKQSMGDDQIRWVANEGIRVSGLVNAIQALQLTADQTRLRDSLLNDEPPHPLEVADRARASEEPASIVVPRPDIPSSQPSASSTWTIPLTVTVNLGAPALGSAPRLSVAASGMSPSALRPDGMGVVEESISIDPNYGNRKGYESKFLGAADREVPLPKLSDAQRAKAAKNKQAKPGEDPTLLAYHHFSVVMNKVRRLAYFTAVNIDGKKAVSVQRDTDHWYFDPRLDKTEQTGEPVYKANPLDRGHLVRRLDPAWGSSNAVAKVANDDTFHFTNCSPQHAEFNQGQNLWAGLEDYILNHAKTEDMKVTVFTGPIFTQSDPRYRSVMLPQEFWKVAVIAKKAGGLSATGYIVSQADLVSGLTEEYVFGAYRTFQVPVRDIERRTGLSFGQLPNSDPLAVAGPDEALHSRIRELGQHGNIVL